MKVLDFNLRTPGIFLQLKKKESGATESEMVLEIWQGDGEPDYTSKDNWKDINEVEEIKVLADVPEPNDLKQGEIRTQKLKVPHQNEGSRTYKLLVPDGKTWYYRITAAPCVECAKAYRDAGIVISWEEVKVLVGKGSFTSEKKNDPLK